MDKVVLYRALSTQQTVVVAIMRTADVCAYVS